MCNQMIIEAKFPTIFKYADVTPVYKTGGKDSASDYRPITILHNLSKILNEFYYVELTSFIEKHSILPNHQFSFRINHSTKDAILSLMLKIENNLLENKRTCCKFLDFSKAFDTVHHETLISILHRLGFQAHLFDVLADYLFNRYLRIKIKKTFS